MEGLQSALTALSASPGSTAGQTAAVTAATGLADTFNTMDTAISGARETADANVGSGVTAVNAALAQIKTNDAAIKKANALGESTASLQDNQGQLVAQISQYIPVNALNNNGSNGNANQCTCPVF